MQQAGLKTCLYAGIDTIDSKAAAARGIAVKAAVGANADAAELLVQYWQAVGVDARFSAQDRTRFYEEKTASQHDIVVWGATSGGIDVFIDCEYTWTPTAVIIG